MRVAPYKSLTEKCARKARAQERNNRIACMCNEHAYLYETKIIFESALFERAELKDKLHFLPLSTGVVAAALLDTADPDVIYGVVCGVEAFGYR